MKREHKNEILFLYIGYFVTLAFGLIPQVSSLAVGVFALQLFYAIIRYVSVNTTEAVFRSHAFNYVLAVGISLLVGLVMMIQAQSIGVGLFNVITGFGAGFTSLGYIAFMMLLEALFAIFWPIILISRGLYLINSGAPITFGTRGGIGPTGSRPTATSHSVAGPQSARWLASAILSNGNVIKFEISSNKPELIIGRGDEYDVSFDDKTVSRPHARMQLKNGSLLINDLDSTNNTFVNDRKIGFNPVQLHPADKVRLGSVELTISAA